MRQCIYSVPCECGRCYIGETGRPLVVRIREHMNNLKQGLMEKSRLAKHAYEEGHRIQWKEAKAAQIETNNICRKYKEAAHMACITNPISQLSLEISPIWIPLIQEEGCRAVHCKNPGLLGKVLCRGLVPTLSNCHRTSLFHCRRCFLLLFYIFICILY
jgi:predicted GIY-YIG superfamily endonuclease